jgi:hypothetical protein
MGALNFDPSKVIAEINDRGRRAANPANPLNPGAQISRLAILAGGHPQKRAGKERKRSSFPPENRGPPPANSANLLISGQLDEKLGQNLLPAFVEAFAQLDPHRPPINFSGRRWREVVEDWAVFLSTWADHAHGLGWATLDLIGAHKLAPEANWSAAGLVLCISGGHVVALTALTATIQRPSGSRVTYTRSSPHPDAVPLWQLLEPLADPIGAMGNPSNHSANCKRHIGDACAGGGC